MAKSTNFNSGMRYLNNEIQLPETEPSITNQ